MLNILNQLGYSRVERVDSLNEYSVRGGVIDINPSHTTHGIRLDFFDDELESIREFNVNTQLDYFNHIVPCGIDDKAVTSVQNEIGKVVDMNDLKVSGLNKYWSTRFLVLSFLFICCLSLINVAYV